MTLNDSIAREQALDPRQSFIVQAPAGSGKTGLLVRRVLKLLCVVDKPEEILAITFTRKATAEMRERVISALQKACDGDSFDTHEQDMAPLAQAVLAHDQQMQWRLLEQPQRLKIQTIDSLCTELVRKMPWSSRFGAMPQIETDLTTFYEQAARNLIEGIDHAPLRQALTTLLIHAGGNLKQLKSQLANMLYQRESWLTLIYADRALSSRQDIEHHWSRLIEAAISALEESLGAALFTQLLELAQYAQLNLSSGSKEDQAKMAILEDSSRKPGLAIRQTQWRAVTNLIATAGSIRKPGGVNKTIGFPNKDTAKSQLQGIIESLDEDQRLLALIAHFRLCPEPALSDGDWNRLQALQSVLPALAQELYLLMAEQGYADYDELSRRAIDALGEADRPTDLALIQDYRLKHILMDEFQDTSPTQLTLLERLTAGWQKGDGRSLFFVGDPMQSIYGFRKADVRVFLNVRDYGINDIYPTPLNLSVNFRSSPDLISWVNRTMKQVFPDKDIPALAKVKYTESSGFRDAPGEVHYHLCISDSPLYERDEILKTITQIRAQHPDDSIAVLARKRAPLAALAAQLRKSRLGFEAVDLESLAEQTIIQDLISLTSVFFQPMDALAWLAVLRAPWAGLSLTDLSLIQQNKLSLQQLSQNTISQLQLSKHGTLALNRVRLALLHTLNSSRGMPLDECIRQAWLGLRGPACYSNHELDHAEAFFSLLQQLEADSAALNRERLLQACIQSKSSSPASNIKLMTLHKAKGLEFDHVILTGLAAKSGGDNRQQALLHSTRKDDLLLVSPNASFSDTPPNKASFIKQYQKSIENEEAVRLLYVAVTRAKQHLYLFGTLKNTSKGTPGAPQQGSLLRLLWDELSESFLETARYIDALPETGEVASERPGVPLKRLPGELDPLTLPENIQFQPQENAQLTEQLEFDWAREDARIIGLFVHQQLEFTDSTQIKNWKTSINLDSVKANLIQFGLPVERSEEAAQRASQILRNIANDDRATWLFDPQHHSAVNEWALSCYHDEQLANYIIDRSFIDAQGIRWIVDFKTSSHLGGDPEKFLDAEEQRYADQLNRYGWLVKNMEPEREIRLGLYFPAMSAWRERAFNA